MHLQIEYSDTGELKTDPKGGEKAYFTQVFEKNFNKDVQGMGATRANLGRMLRSLDLMGWSRREETGRLDRRALTRFATGDINIFSWRESKMADASAVTILVDCSGSMHGDTMVVAGQVSTQLSKLLEQSRINYAVTGFTGSEPNHNFDRDSGVHVEEVHFIPFKERGESLRAAAPKMGSIQRMALSGNPDYSSLMFAIEEIKAQKEQRKIIFFLTDTGSYDAYQMKQVSRIAEIFKITIIGIGIGTDDVKSLFKHGVDVKNIDDMGKDTFSTMLRTLRAKD
jgi:cobalamin biosynthesis protein CobT